MGNLEEQLKDLEAKVADVETRKDKAVKEWSLVLASELRQEFNEATLELIKVKKEIAINSQNYREAAELRDQQSKLEGKDRFIH